MVTRQMNDKLLKTAFSEFYLSLIMTQNYVKHNLQGFQKIMKKFDKNLNCKVANKTAMIDRNYDQ